MLFVALTALVACGTCQRADKGPAPEPAAQADAATTAPARGTDPSPPAPLVRVANAGRLPVSSSTIPPTGGLNLVVSAESITVDGTRLVGLARPLDGGLPFISEKVLDAFERIDPRTDVDSQPRWQAPRSVVYNYPLGRAEDPEKKYQACVAWLTADITDSFDVLVMTVLGQVLLGNAASPLRKALIDSNLGTALSDGTGYDPDNRDTMFVCGLKDVRESDGEKIAR